MKTLNQISMFLLLAGITFFSPQRSYGHCEIPCGIYDDSVRIKLIKEHMATIEKSMNSIIEISESAQPDYNQLVRWINNKEEHAEKIQEIVSRYFLHQRIKIIESADDPGYAQYIKQLELLHHLLVYSMKCKQTTDKSYIEKLRETTALFEKSYFHHDH